MKNGTEFNVGDRVIYHNDKTIYPLSNNEIATVLKVISLGLYIEFDVNIENYNSIANMFGAKPGHGLYVIFSDCLEHIEQDQYEEWND